MIYVYIEDKARNSMKAMDKRIGACNSAISIPEFPSEEKLSVGGNQVLKDAYIQANKDIDRLKAIEEWEIFD